MKLPPESYKEEKGAFVHGTVITGLPGRSADPCHHNLMAKILPRLPRMRVDNTQVCDFNFDRVRFLCCSLSLARSLSIAALLSLSLPRQSLSYLSLSLACFYTPRSSLLVSCFTFARLLYLLFTLCLYFAHSLFLVCVSSNLSAPSLSG